MHSYLSLRRFRTLAFIISAIFLWGCVGEGDGPQRIAGTPAPTLTGVLIDAPVSGASYLATSGLSGITNAAGEFQYQRSDLVTFSIGGIVLGTVQGAAYITVVELTNSIDPTARAATNMLIFLQSIDSDGDPTNGITISAATRTAAAGRSLDFFAADFDTQVAAIVAAIAPGNSVISASDALFNFYQAYAELGGTDTFDFGFPGFPPVGGGVTYELVFADEFDGDALKAGNWNIETGYGPNGDGWGNNEWQLYTDSADNVRVEDGNLVISAQCPTPPCGVRDGTVTSARINSLDKVEFRYGKIIARIKPPVGAGTWPAFWSMGANFPDIGWPRSGEIDFMEMFATSNSRTTHSAIHWCDETSAPPLPAFCPRSLFTQSRTFAQSLGDDFHIWEADWTPDRITVSMDGVQYFDAAIDPATQEEFLRDFFLIFNVAMGGDLGSGGQPPNGTEVFPQTMLVDYVRVYQQVGDGPAGDVLVDFEDDPASYDFGEFDGFGGGATGVIPNPDPSGINTTAQVAQMQKNAAGGEVFGGATLNLGSNLNFAQGQVFKMKVWATRLVPVLFKLEDTTSEPPIPENGLERFVDHTGSGMWEELCFDFTGATANFTSSKITFIFDLGVVGDAENNPNDWTFYYDEIEQTDSCDSVEPPPPPPPLISSFSNGSFETGDLSDWTGDGNNTVGAPGVGAFAGTLAAKLTTTGGTGVAEIRQTFAANPGDEINFSAYVLTEAALPAGDTFGLAKIVFKDAAGNDLDPESASIGILVTGENAGIDSRPLLNSDSLPNTWIFTEAQGVAPAGTTQVTVLLLNVDFAGGENPMWFDFVELSLVTDEPPPPPMALAISNGDFETNDLSPWISLGDNSVGAPGVGAHAGSMFAARLNNAANGVAELSQTFDAAAGDEINFAAWMLTEAQLPAGPIGLLKIVFKDADGVILMPASASIGVINTDFPGVESTPVLNDGSAINTWIFTEAQGVAPAGTTQVQLLVLNVDFAGGGNAMWFDSVEASLVTGEPPPPPMALAISNGDFETNDLSPWISLGDNSVGAPGVGAHAGSMFAARLNNAANGVAELSQTFDAAAGDEINFAAWMLTEAQLPAGPIGLLKIVFKDADGVILMPASASIGVINTDFPGVESTPVLNDGSAINTWIFTEAQGVAPAGTTQVQLLVLNVDFAGGGNAMWFDSVEASLVTGEPPPPPMALAISNGDFETNDLSPWISLGDNSVGAPGVGAHAGSMFAARLNNAANGVAELSQTFDAAAGDEINFAAWMLTEAQLPAGPIGLLKIVFKDADGVILMPASASIGVINTDFPGVESTPVLNDGSAINTWIFTEAQGVAPAGTTQVQLLVLNVDFAGGGNAMWFDSVEASLVTGEPPPPPMALAISNGDFETNDLSPWISLGDNSVGAPGVGAHAGSMFAARLNNAANGVAELSQTFDAAAGDEINFAAWMLTEAQLPAGPIGLLKIVFKDADGVILMPASASIGVINTDFPGVESTPVLNDGSAINTWIFTEAQGVAPAGTTQVQLLVLNVDFAGGGNAMWFDSVEASLVTGEPPPPPMALAISNGDFETNDLSPWISLGDNSVGAPGVGAHAGSMFAARLNNAANGVAELSQTFDAAAGDEINFAAWMLTEAQLPAGPIGLLKIVFKDADGVILMPASASIGVINTDFPGVESTPVLNDGSAINTWIFTEAQGVAPAGTTQVQLLVLNVDFAGGGNAMWFDSVEASLVTGEPPPPPMALAISNGDFETNDLSPWISLGDNSVGAPGVGAHAGSMFAARLNNAANGVAELSQTFDAAAGDEINFAAWMLTEAQLPAGPIGLLKIVFKDADGVILMPASASIGVINTDFPGVESTPVLNDGSAINTWIFTEAQGVAPAGTTQVQLLVLNVDFAGGGNAMWFDSVEASLVTGEPPPPPMALAISNGDFETNDLSPWISLGDNSVGAPGVGAHAGSMFAARLNNAANGVAELSQTFDAAAGDEINFAAWMLTEAQLPAGPIGLLKIVFKDADGVILMPASASIGVINTDFPGVESTPVLNDGSAINTWIFTEAQGVAPAGTTQVQLLVLNVDFAGGGNAMWFDSVEASLVTGEPPPPPMALAISNGDFETNDLSPWISLGDNSVGAPGVGAHAGSMFAARLNNAANGVAELSQTFDAAAGDEINFAAWMLTEAQLPAGPIGLLKIVFKDADGVILMPASASIGVINTDFPGVESTPVLNDGSAINTWIFTEAQGVAPAGTTQVQLLVLNVDFAGGGNAMWFDSVEASLVTGEPPPPPMALAISNGDFETNDLSPWISLGDNSVGAPGVGAHAGSMFAARLNNAANGVAELSQTFDAAAGDEINFAAWMLTEAQLPAGPIGLLKIVFKDADGVILMPASASIGVINTDFPGVESTPVLNDGSAINTWIFTEAQGVAPAGTTQVQLLVLNVDFAGGGNAMWFDSVEASLVDACGASNGELATNGDFELGNFDCWDLFPGGGTIEADNTENNTIDGTWSAHLVAGPGNNPVIKQSFLAADVVQPGDTVNISFDMKGSAIAGGVIAPELINEEAEGQSSGQVLETIVAPTADWTTYFYSPMAGADVSGGITFQIAVICGADNSCSNDVFIDNVSIIISPGGG